MVDAFHQISSVEAVGPFAQVARQMFGGDAVMGADEPGFDRAEQGMDDREKLGGFGTLILNDGRVFEMVIECRLFALIAGKAVGHLSLIHI